MKKLTEQDITNWRDAQKFEGLIIDRIEFIFNAIYNTFGKRLNYWYFDGAGEGEVGNIPEYDLPIGNNISAICDPPYRDFVIYSSVENKVLHLDQDGFPSRWLYEDFEEELKTGKEDYLQYVEDEKKRKKELAEKKKAEKEEEAKKRGKEIKALMEKLSPEERKLLKKLG